MKHVTIAGINTPVSQFVLGGPFGERSDDESFGILDRFVALGGTAIETAHSYAEGTGEEQVGRWVKNRRCRAKIVLITKICHPQNGQSASIRDFGKELDISVSRLGGEPIDVVLLHRDPVTTNAGQILELFEAVRESGVISSYGISNIRGHRLREFDAAAKVLGAPGLAVVSNYYGLAKQASPAWPGALELDAESQQWLVQHRCPLICWSSLAQGWFANRELLAPFRAVYDTALNRARRNRVERLAPQLGMTPLQVALAFTLAAPFDVLASVGPRSTEELAEVLKSDSHALSALEYNYLENGESLERI